VVEFLDVGRLGTVEIACPTAIPSHFELWHGLHNEALLIAVLTANALPNVPVHVFDRSFGHQRSSCLGERCRVSQSPGVQEFAAGDRKDNSRWAGKFKPACER
jgi:hypothetical protein